MMLTTRLPIDTSKTLAINTLRHQFNRYVPAESPIAARRYCAVSSGINDNNPSLLTSGFCIFFFFLKSSCSPGHLRRTHSLFFNP